MKKYHYLYELRLKSDPRYYYRGKHSTNNLEDGYLGSGSQVKLLRKQYGEDCFTKVIVRFCNSLQEVLTEEEQYVGDLWKSDPFCLNLTPGGAFQGKFDMTGVPKSEHTRELSRQGRLGKRHTEETKERISKTKKGTKLSEETRLRMQKARLGKPRPVSVAEKVSKALSGRPKSKEHVEKIRACKVGRIWIHKDSKSKQIFPAEFSVWENLGWSKGRVLGQGRPVGIKLNYIHKGTERKQVSNEDLPVFLENGWKKGTKDANTEG